MRKVKLLTMFLAIFFLHSSAQEIVLNNQANLEQVYLKSYTSKALMPMNDLNMEFGYVIYQSEINVLSENAVLELENVRDYAVIFVDDKLQGTLKDDKKKITLNISPGKHKLKLFVENIGRITYGPEILDNSKGLFGSIVLDGNEIENWTMIPLNIKGVDVARLTFEERKLSILPSFIKGQFNIANPADCYLDISGWGMGEVWINGKYIGAYWEEEKQQSIQISADVLKTGKNQIIVFEMKNPTQKTIKITNQPVFH